MADPGVEEDQVARGQLGARDALSGVDLRVRGACRLMPAAFQAAWVRPEQSKAFGPVAPQTYGFPIAPWAKAIACPAREFGAETGAARPVERSAWAGPPPCRASAERS
ncbi:hypothetical protein SCALM49S_00888 [Streptomyces californicus]